IAEFVGLDASLFGKRLGWNGQSMLGMIADKPLQKGMDIRRRDGFAEELSEMEPAAAVAVGQQWAKPHCLQALKPVQHGGQVDDGTGAALTVPVHIYGATKARILDAG